MYVILVYSMFTCKWSARFQASQLMFPDLNCSLPVKINFQIVININIKNL